MARLQLDDPKDPALSSLHHIARLRHEAVDRTQDAQNLRARASDLHDLGRTAALDHLDRCRRALADGDTDGATTEAKAALDCFPSAEAHTAMAHVLIAREAYSQAYHEIGCESSQCSGTT